MQNDFVSRDEVLNLAYTRPFDEYGSHISPKDVKGLPVADVVQVVRCKDCEHWHRGEHNYGECNKISERDNEGGASFDCDTEANDYCSDGWPRKESCV